MVRGQESNLLLGAYMGLRVLPVHHPAECGLSRRHRCLKLTLCIYANEPFIRARMLYIIKQADCIPNTKKRDNPIDGHPLPIFQTYPRPRPRLGPAPINWLPSWAVDGADHRPLPKERSPDSELYRPVKTKTYGTAHHCAFSVKNTL